MPGTTGLYDSSFEHDSCGTGFIADIKGRKSHQIITDALTILESMEHRGACGCEDNTGDGAGIMLQIPHEFFFKEGIKNGFRLPFAGDYGAGMVFFPTDPGQREECKQIINRSANKLNLKILGYRAVPIDNTDIGPTALNNAPGIEQVFIAGKDDTLGTIELERKLFILRNYTSHLISNTISKRGDEFYFVSLSAKTIIYKGQLTSSQVRNFFPDLRDDSMVSAFGMIHSRFSTNTFPSWKLAQPFRYIAHNGEINTLQGNLNWLRTGEKGFTSPLFSPEEMEMLLPIVTPGQSDSACLDNIIELLVLSGRSLPHVMMMLIPEAWDGNEHMDPVKKAFYEYHSSFMEPWDGPACISFTDGNIIGATLDRNGLRPSRYSITKDGRVIMASETGVLPIDPSVIIEKGRLQPGKIFVVDMVKGCVINDNDLKNSICSQQPYSTWLNKYKIRLEELPEPRVMFTHLEHDQVFKYQKAFGYTSEDLNVILTSMAVEGKEPVGSMGRDIPLAILSEEPQHLSHYFKQLFAQVTNPPIDPIREKMVMSLSTFAGNNGNLLIEDPLTCHSVALKHPVLTNYELEKIRSIDTGLFQAKTIQCYFKADGHTGSLQKGLSRICEYAVDAVEDGFKVLILQDRAIDSNHAAIPSLLATAAVHHHLIRNGMRGKVGIIVEAGDVWEVHHFACLIGFGATAVNPYLAFSSIRDLQLCGKISEAIGEETLFNNYIYAVNAGLLKVFSKMGISTLQSYQGAQIFEILGISKEVVNKYFTGAISRLGGLNLDDIATEALIKHDLAFRKKDPAGKRLPPGGVYQWNIQGEYHLFNPRTIHLLQQATSTNNPETFHEYSQLVNDQAMKASTLRGMLTMQKSRASISIDEVEAAENIYYRFATGAMSFGSISWEAHTTLAIAMNRLGGKSNTGEGGEDESRYIPYANGDSARSAVKQIASARFGVNALYLTEADELQIKMAQGAKPGEGGQLPGDKVDEFIAKVRHSTPGVGLISPPPHHDIYSIEDLAQLIFDLKNANRHARVSVKLVSKAGVGTIAAGVTKAKADVLLIAGLDGGTGASPISSIRHTGLPWELGLAETHQTLLKNNLRSRIILQADGQLKTGRDIAIATLLGAEEWGIATAALIVEGCIMMRKCHLNTCPVGVATQDPELRKQFTGNADHVVNFFKLITEELREIMAELGFRTINEMVGQSDILQVRENLSHWKLKKLDFAQILYKSQFNNSDVQYCTGSQEQGLEHILDWELLKKAEPALAGNEKVSASFPIKNTDRTTGTLLSHEITKLYRKHGLPEDSIHFKFTGTAGQSFGAFTTKGMTLEIEGDANDYFGKGLSGAKLIIYPSRVATFNPEENSIIGNVAFYGATDGEAFIRGKAGERFCVRNSGARVVVESVGDHGCEYMTGGIVIILGKTGRNFAAGMSGGLAYVYDVKNEFSHNCNMELVDLDECDQDDREVISAMITKHETLTGSTVANFISRDIDNQLRHFVKIFPKDYKRVINSGKYHHPIDNIFQK